jgi:zinc and cadmium transporter
LTVSSLIYALVAVSLISLISLVGVVAISLREATLDRVLFVLLSFSAGTILGTAYLDLLPEAVEVSGPHNLATTALYITIGFAGFFFLERFVYWFHGHVHGYRQRTGVDERIGMREFVYLNVLGDGVHNLIDGMIIAASFLSGVPVGLAATVAVVFHELPQEIGDFGVLVYGGFTPVRALLFNFASALTAVVGVLLANYFALHIQNFLGILLAAAAGGFIYIAAAELIPEMQKERDVRRSIGQFALFLLGIALIWTLGVVFHT